MEITFGDADYTGFLSLGQIREFLRYRAQESDSGDIYDENGNGVGFWEFRNGLVEITKF
mgnify:CR=1 FL=1